MTLVGAGKSGNGENARAYELKRGATKGGTGHGHRFPPTFATNVRGHLRSCQAARLRQDPSTVHTFLIDHSILTRWESIQRTSAREASIFYFCEILPQVVAHQQSKGKALANCDLLVSLMGFSPETTVITTALLRPRRLVVVASENAKWHLELCQSFLSNHKLLAVESMSSRMIDPLDHRGFFKILTDELSKENGRRVVDLTGGKKIMSAVAGYAAWSLGLPVCYLESRAYNEKTRRPEPGSEEILMLEPPTTTAC